MERNSTKKAVSLKILSILKEYLPYTEIQKKLDRIKKMNLSCAFCERESHEKIFEQVDGECIVSDWDNTVTDDYHYNGMYIPNNVCSSCFKHRSIITSFRHKLEADYFGQYSGDFRGVDESYLHLDLRDLINDVQHRLYTAFGVGVANDIIGHYKRGIFSKTRILMFQKMNVSNF